MIVFAKFVGEPESIYYRNNDKYLLRVKKRFFSGRIRIANIHGYGNKEYWDSVREYRNEEMFEHDWQILKYVDEIKADSFEEAKKFPRGL